jgi:hypothetical protein
MPQRTRSTLRFTRGLAIVPAFNESASIAAVIKDLRAHVPELHAVVIDDGSTDGTARHVPPGTTVISLPFNLGIGGAVQTGYRFAARGGYEVAVQVDGDGQHPAAEVRRLLERLAEGDADLVIGSRFLAPGGYRQGLARRAGSLVLRTLLRLLTGLRFTDCTSGFRAANRRVIEAFAEHYPEDYPEPEVVVLLHRAGLRVVEVPVTMSPRAGGITSIPLLRGVYYVVKVSVAIVLATMRQPWPRGETVPG